VANLNGPTNPIRFSKTIVNLPSTLTPDSLFAVRRGVGMDLYVSDMTGSQAYKTNSPISIDSTGSDTVTSVTSLSFDSTSGFSVTDLGNGHAFISASATQDLSVINAATRLIQTQRIMAQMVSRGHV
jgi:hypothetical protein